jgi:hypothetical protein
MSEIINLNDRLNNSAGPRPDLSAIHRMLETRQDEPDKPGKWHVGLGRFVMYTNAFNKTSLVNKEAALQYQKEPDLGYRPGEDFRLELGDDAAFAILDESTLAGEQLAIEQLKALYPEEFEN